MTGGSHEGVEDHPAARAEVEDMRIRGMPPKTQQAHIRAVRYFAEFIGRSRDTATQDG